MIEARIKFDHENRSHYLDADPRNEMDIYDFLRSRDVPDDEAEDAAAWAVTACIGEQYDGYDFYITIHDAE